MANLLVDEGTATNVKASGAGTGGDPKIIHHNVEVAGTTPTLNTGVRDAGTLRVTVATDDVVPVTDNGGKLTVDWNGVDPPIGAGTEAGALRVTLATDSTGVVSVDDNGGKLTVDWNGVDPPIGAGTEAGALRVTLATDSTGVVSIDDGGGNISTDWAGTVPPIGAGTEAAALRVTVATDSTGVLTVDGSAVTQPISAATLPLPTGAATSALQSNTVSTNNSTTATLGISGVFTGTGDDVSTYASVTVQMDASHDSATNGVQFQFSTDNSNWDDTHDFSYTAADGARRFQFPVTAQYFRCVYTNGGTGQTHFRMQTILHRSNVLTSIHQLSGNTRPDRSAQVVKAAIIAQNAGSGDFIPVQATAAGNFKMALEEYDGVPVGGGVESGALRVTLANDSTGLVSVDDGGASLTVDGTVTADAGTGPWPVTDNGGKLTVDWNGTDPPIGAGTEATALRVTLATDSTGLVSVDDGGGSLTVDGTVSVTGVATAANQLPDGHNVTIDNASGASAVNIQDGGNSITIDGTVTANAGTGTMTVDLGANNDVVVNVATTGGCTMFRDNDLDETDVAVKASAGTLYGWAIHNAASATRYIQFYNAGTGAVTVGTTTPDMTIGIPAGATSNVNYMPQGIDFGTAITAAATTGHSDAGAPGANELIVSILYE